jgi:hypothetical protein
MTDNDEKPVKVESIYVRAATDAISKSDKPTVRRKYKKKSSELTDRITDTPTVAPTVPDRLHDITVRFDT